MLICNERIDLCSHLIAGEPGQSSAEGEDEQLEVRRADAECFGQVHVRGCRPGADAEGCRSQSHDNADENDSSDRHEDQLVGGDARSEERRRTREGL